MVPGAAHSGWLPNVFPRYPVSKAETEWGREQGRQEREAETEWGKEQGSSRGREQGRVVRWRGGRQRGHTAAHHQ